MTFHIILPTVGADNKSMTYNVHKMLSFLNQHSWRGTLTFFPIGISSERFFSFSRLIKEPDTFCRNSYVRRQYSPSLVTGRGWNFHVILSNKEHTHIRVKYEYTRYMISDWWRRYLYIMLATQPDSDQWQNDVIGYLLPRNRSATDNE